jgi:hypothetical protein
VVGGIRVLRSETGLLVVHDALEDLGLAAEADEAPDGHGAVSCDLAQCGEAPDLAAEASLPGLRPALDLADPVLAQQLGPLCPILVPRHLAERRREALGLQQLVLHRLAELLRPELLVGREPGFGSKGGRTLGHRVEDVAPVSPGAFVRPLLACTMKRVSAIGQGLVPPLLHPEPVLIGEATPRQLALLPSVGSVGERPVEELQAAPALPALLPVVVPGVAAQGDVPPLLGSKRGFRGDHLARGEEALLDRQLDPGPDRGQTLPLARVSGIVGHQNLLLGRVVRPRRQVVHDRRGEGRRSQALRVAERDHRAAVQRIAALRDTGR